MDLDGDIAATIQNLQPGATHPPCPATTAMVKDKFLTDENTENELAKSYDELMAAAKTKADFRVMPSAVF